MLVQKNKCPSVKNVHLGECLQYEVKIKSDFSPASALCLHPCQIVCVYIFKKWKQLRNTIQNGVVEFFR